MFDVEKFTNTKFVPRIREIPLPGLKSFFPEDEKPIFIVRCLEGEELARIRDYVQEYFNISKLVESLIAGNQQEKINAIRETYGISEKVPGDYARRLKLLQVGCIDPKIDQQMLVFGHDQNNIY